MKKKEAVRQMDKLWKKMKKPLKAFISGGEQEELHQFRVQVKKLKAMLQLYACEPGNQAVLKDFKPIKTVFKKAGEIRNAHINLKLGEKHQLNNEGFRHHQQQNLDHGSKAFKNKGCKYLKSIKKAHLVLQNNLGRLHNKTIRNFYHNKLVQLDDFFARITFNDELHEARKNIKLLIYNQKIAARAIQNKMQLDYGYLDDLQNCIGEWHDHNLAAETLSGIAEAEHPAVIDLRNSNNKLEKEILEKSNSFMKKVKTLAEIASA